MPNKRKTKTANRPPRSDPPPSVPRSDPPPSASDLVAARIEMRRDVRAFVNSLAAQSSTNGRITSAEMFGLILARISDFCRARHVANYTDFLRALPIDPPGA